MTNNPSGVKGVGSSDAYLAIQCTRSAKTAGMVRGTIGEDANALADDIYLVNVGRIILAFDREIVDDHRRTEFITQVCKWSDGMLGYASQTKLQQRGNGCQINIPADVADSAEYTTAISSAPIRSPENDGLFLIYPRSEVDATFIDRLVNEWESMAEQFD